MFQNDMKKESFSIRIDSKTLEILRDANTKSGIPISEIIRKGALQEAVQILSLYKHVNTNTSTQERTNS